VRPARINPAKVHHFFRIEASLKENPAKIQEFLTFPANKGTFADKSCTIAGFFNFKNKIEKNDVFLHHFGSK